MVCQVRLVAKCLRRLSENMECDKNQDCVYFSVRYLNRSAWLMSWCPSGYCSAIWVVGTRLVGIFRLDCTSLENLFQSGLPLINELFVRQKREGELIVIFTGMWSESSSVSGSCSHANGKMAVPFNY